MLAVSGGSIQNELVFDVRILRKEKTLTHGPEVQHNLRSEVESVAVPLPVGRSLMFGDQ